MSHRAAVLRCRPTRSRWRMSPSLCSCEPSIMPAEGQRPPCSCARLRGVEAATDGC